MTPDRRLKLQPFIPALLKRYGEVAETGSSERPNPVCNTCKVGECAYCAVWGVMGDPDENRAFVHCDSYMPTTPDCVSDRDRRVAVSLGGKCAAKNLAAAMAYGKAVCEWLEGQRIGKYILDTT